MCLNKVLKTRRISPNNNVYIYKIVDKTKYHNGEKECYHTVCNFKAIYKDEWNESDNEVIKMPNGDMYISGWHGYLKLKDAEESEFKRLSNVIIKCMVRGRCTYGEGDGTTIEPNNISQLVAQEIMFIEEVTPRIRKKPKIFHQEYPMKGTI